MGNGEFLTVTEKLFEELRDQDRRISNNYKRIQSLQKKLKELKTNIGT